MKKIKLSGILAPLLLSFTSNANALSVRTLRGQIGGEFSKSPTQIDGSRSIFNIISLVNNYLWFAVGFVCFLFMIRNGYLLIMARGDEKQMKDATNALIGCGVGLIVCLLAYIIVNITVKLFL